MRDPRIPFRSRGIAALLAFLLPGAGHFYQGRRLKAGIFATCILSTFFAGMVLGDWQPVYSQVIVGPNGGPESAQLDRAKLTTGRSLGYYAQIFAGLPALPALVQSLRCTRPENQPVEELDAVLNTEFEGIIRDHRGQRFDYVAGQLAVEPGRGKTVTGSFSGTNVKTGESVTADIGGRAQLGRPVFGSPLRQVRFNLASDEMTGSGTLEGTVERPLLDWYQAPRDNTELDRMHNTLSQNYDMGCVFTWIAGLLNLMVIWDAFDGPAYAYGDEADDEDEEDE